ncbi:MAG: T9SS type A sorting domain-containing protein [Bacteroidales bacterium]|nr:T9SS type A sorting domain-containing protein [Bacteroidales bacterium]
MKKILLSLLLLACVKLNAQSLEILYNNQPVGDTLQLNVTEVNNFMTFYLEIANNSDRSVKMGVRRQLISMLPGTSNMFCFSTNCFDHDEPTETYTINALDTFSFDKDSTAAFHLTYYADGNFGQSIVRYTFYNSMIDIDTTSLIVIFDSKSADIQSNNNITNSVFPNPTIDNCHITFNHPLTENCALQLFDMTGKMIYKTIVPAGTSSQEINLSSYSSGLYLLKLQEKENTNTIKIQKQ